MEADAVVIGAGAAGLAAARSLAGRSVRVVLLEARDRSGGRVWSQSAPRGGVAAELGAEFIHGAAPATMALLREAGAAAVDLGAQSWSRGPNGTLVRDNREFVEAARILEGSRSLAIDESVDAYLRRFDGNGALAKRVADARLFVEGFEAADPALASVHSIADELRSGVDSNSTRPLGGYGPAFALLQRACFTAGVDLRFSSIVQRVSWRRGTVAIDVLGAGGDVQTIRSRVAVVTVPAGVLKHRGDDAELVFEPELPESKRAALAQIEMGHVVKTALWFRSAFWERVDGGRYRDAAFFRIGAAPITAVWTQVPVRSELLVTWIGGPKARALNGLSSDQRVERALQELGAFFGTAEVRDEFESALAHDWSADRFSRGAYSYVAVGGAGARATLAAPLDGTLFFAGEATSMDDQGGTVNGALESGERAAREAAQVLNG
ncbi:MAG TPA: NAD(P)/FAD-dependent oxidoreductase [Candidatus Cybelea sp.]|nr:NAD(P)/FAD-dependent oxidoreductase [Candidatus Cybelea sp.]